ncbi:MAG TPA: FtsX-like permease family protein [Acidimicrobiales bacterium]|nr:FtsX-like permease family protein [Acidimicrobiales bacterium]
MWRLALRDLQWRRRRFVISVLGTSLVFTVALILAGVASSFGVEADRAIQGFGADAWVVHAGTPGPFTSGLPIPDTAIAQLASSPGVREAAGLIYGLQSVGPLSRPSNVNLFGVSRGNLGFPAPVEGRRPRRDDETMVDSSLGDGLGQHITMGTRSFTVVGLLRHSTLLAGTPNMFVTMRAAQQLVFEGQRQVTAVLLRGEPLRVPARYRLLSPATVKSDMTRALAKAQQVISFLELFLWLIAACIIGSVVYISALEKTRDFAVLKATGSANSQLISGMALQATVISLGAAVIAVALGVILVPTFPIVVDIPGWALGALPGLAVVIGLLASVAGLRRVNAVQPAMAFGGP